MGGPFEGVWGRVPTEENFANSINLVYFKSNMKSLGLK